MSHPHSPSFTLRALAVFAAMALFATFGKAHASTVPLTLEQLVAVADEVVTVRVAGSEAKISQGRITTTTKMEVLETFKGEMKGSEEITYLGGRWRSLVMDVPNVPQFRKGEEAVLFLSRPIDRMPDEMKAQYNLDSPLVQSYQVVGGYQGKFLLVDNEGLPNVSERKDNDPIPFNTRVVRQAGASTGDPSKSPEWSDFQSAITFLVQTQKAKASSDADPVAIGGIMGKFHVPERSDSPAIRRFDPLPSMAYASDEELKALQDKMSKAHEARKSGQDEDSGGEEEGQ